jgi:hypothetical protein
MKERIPSCRHRAGVNPRAKKKRGPEIGPLTEGRRERASQLFLEVLAKKLVNMGCNCLEELHAGHFIFPFSRSLRVRVTEKSFRHFVQRKS